MDYEIYRNGEPIGIKFPTGEEAWEYIEETPLGDGAFTVREVEG